MANTYSQIYLQFVFAVKFRAAVIAEQYRVEVEKYISGIVSNRNGGVLAIYCRPDHIHILVNIRPTESIPDLVREIKSSSTAFINTKRWTKCKFQWQAGYGVFSYGRSQLDIVARYIANQHQHHERSSFRTEYLGLLKKFEIDFKPKYLFDFW